MFVIIGELLILYVCTLLYPETWNYDWSSAVLGPVQGFVCCFFLITIPGEYSPILKLLGPVGGRWCEGCMVWCVTERLRDIWVISPGHFQVSPKFVRLFSVSLALFFGVFSGFILLCFDLCLFFISFSPPCKPSLFIPDSLLYSSPHSFSSALQQW